MAAPTIDYTVREISPLDHHLLQAGVITTAVATLPHQLDKQKRTRQRQPQPIAQNLQLLKENSQLRCELAFFKAREQALLSLFHKCFLARDTLDEAVKHFSEASNVCEEELATGLGAQLDTAGLNDFRVI